MKLAANKGIWLGAALMAVSLAHVVPLCASPVWPSPPDQARVEFMEVIRCEDLSPERGFFGKVGRFLGGDSQDEHIYRPFDIRPVDGALYMTCQDFTALVRVNVVERSFKLFRCDDHPLKTPVGLAEAQGKVFVADSGSGIVYRLDGGDLEPWITANLIRPTGVAVSADEKTLFVIDTGDHRIKKFDMDGNPTGEIGERGEADESLNFPTFATGSGNGLLVNDTLNYRLKTFDAEGVLLGAFGEEGNGPGTFARPKGVAVAPDGNIWVVDALFDNIQIFDGDGRLLLVIGGSGQMAGEFWSPAGIAIQGDIVYVADTFNNRIQVLRNLGGGS